MGCHNNTDWAQSVLPSANVVAMRLAGMFFPARVDIEFTHFLCKLHFVTSEIDINSLFRSSVGKLVSSSLHDEEAS